MMKETIKVMTRIERCVLIRPRWMLLVKAAIGGVLVITVFGPTFSIQVWSIICAAIVWPRVRLIFGVIR